MTFPLSPLKSIATWPSLVIILISPSSISLVTFYELRKKFNDYCISRAVECFRKQYTAYSYTQDVVFRASCKISSNVILYLTTYKCVTHLSWPIWTNVTCAFTGLRLMLIWKTFSWIMMRIISQHETRTTKPTLTWVTETWNVSIKLFSKHFFFSGCHFTLTWFVFFVLIRDNIKNMDWQTCKGTIKFCLVLYFQDEKSKLKHKNWKKNETINGIKSKGLIN